MQELNCFIKFPFRNDELTSRAEKMFTKYFGVLLASNSQYL